MLHDIYLLSTPSSRQLVKEAIIEVCSYRGWKLVALHVRTTHIHAVVNAEATPRRIVVDWKAYTARRLRVDEPTRAVYWARGGSVRALKTERDVRRAVAYVLEQQGEPLETFCAE
jgi:REP element-mobilizing transposase RayT